MIGTGKGPFVIRPADGSYGRVVEFIYPHESGGLCFLDVGRGLNGYMNPFHIVLDQREGKGNAGEGIANNRPEVLWHLPNGSTISGLAPNDPEWANWQRWLDYLESPDGSDVEDETTIEAMKRQGALIDQPL